MDLPSLVALSHSGAGAPPAETEIQGKMDFGELRHAVVERRAVLGSST